MPYFGASWKKKTKNGPCYPIILGSHLPGLSSFASWAYTTWGLLNQIANYSFQKQTQNTLVWLCFLLILSNQPALDCPSQITQLQWTYFNPDWLKSVFSCQGKATFQHEMVHTRSEPCSFQELNAPTDDTPMAFFLFWGQGADIYCLLSDSYHAGNRVVDCILSHHHRTYLGKGKTFNKYLHK